MEASAINSATPGIDAIVLAYENTSLNITQRLIDANPNIINPIAIWQDFGSISPNSTDDLKVKSLRKRSLQKRGSATVSTSIGIGSYQINLGQYFVQTLDFSINAGGLVDVLVLENAYVPNCKYGSSDCIYYTSCSCINMQTCSKRCTGLDIYNSYSILILRYIAPTVTVTGSYTYTSGSSTSSSVFYSSESTIYTQIAVPIFVFLFVCFLIFKYYQFRRRNNENVTVYPTNDQAQMQENFNKLDQPSVYIPTQTAGYGAYTPTYGSAAPVYTVNQTWSNQPHNNQNYVQPYNPHGNTRDTYNTVGTMNPLDGSDYRGTRNTAPPLDRNDYQ